MTNSPLDSYNDSSNTDMIDSILEEEGGKEKLEMMVRREMSLSTELYQESSISDKITSEHISQYLISSEKNMEKTFDDNKSQRRFTITLSLIGVIAILVVIGMLKDNKEILQYVLTSIVSVILGGFGGYGIGKNNSL